MTRFEEIVQRARHVGENALEMTSDEIDALSMEEIDQLCAEFGAYVLLRLPGYEREFFEWLREADPEVFHDLWADDDQLLVSLPFLRIFHGSGPFPICELEQCDNYFFTTRHIKPNGAAALSGILERAARQLELSVSEALMFEILKAPIDIWHFCYRYDVPIELGKTAVREMTAHDWIVHLTDREDLVKYIDQDD